MKKNKGFTIIEIIVVIGLLMIIAGIFSINFVKSLSTGKDREFKEAVTGFENATSLFVNEYKNNYSENYDIIRLTIASDDEAHCYIPLEELKDTGYINESNVNPYTNEEFNGVVKFTKEEDGQFKFEYVDDGGDYFIVYYKKNGVKDIGKTNQVIICDKSSDTLSSCADEYKLPTITDDTKDEESFAWSTNKDAHAGYKPNTPLKEIFKEVKDDSKSITLYAISRKTVNVNEKPCTVYNNESKCIVEDPNYICENDIANLSNGASAKCNPIPKPVPTQVNPYFEITEERPLNANLDLTFILDTSGSMSSYSRIQNLNRVVTHLVKNIDLNTSLISIIPFQSSSSVLLWRSNDLNTINSKISTLGASGGTNFTSPISLYISQTSTSNKIDKDKYVIFVSDGDAKQPTYDLLNQFHSIATVYTVGVGSGITESTLRSIASQDDYFFSYKDTSDSTNLSKLLGIFSKIAINIVKESGNVIKLETVDGKVKLENAEINDEYPLEIRDENNNLVENITTEYLTKDKNENTWFDIFNYVKNRYGLNNMDKQRSLKITYYRKA